MALEKKWKDLGAKDKIQYIMAIVLIASGILLAFVSFAFTFTIATGSLIYISEAFITAGGIFGVSIYFRSKLGEFESTAADKIYKIVEQALDNHKEEHHNEDNSESEV